MISFLKNGRKPPRLVIIGLSAAFVGGFLIGAVSTNHFSWPEIAPALAPAVAPARHAEARGLSVAGHELEVAAPSPAVGQRSTVVDQLELEAEPLLTFRPEYMGPDLVRPKTPAETLAAIKEPALSEEPALAKLPAAPEIQGAQISTVVVKRGDTLVTILLDAGLDIDHAHEALAAIEDVYDPRTLRPGQEIRLAVASNDAQGDADPLMLHALTLNLDFENELQLTSASGRYEVAKQAKILDHATYHKNGSIEDSLYVAAAEQDVPTETILELVKIFSWDVDFQRDIHSGHAFELVFDQLTARDRQESRGGHVHYAKLDLGEDVLEAYRFEQEGGTVGYFDPDGRSVRKQFMRTPVDGARLSSGFGKRRHPILGYTKMHKGVDFAAPTGTPIYAAADGRVEVAGRNGGYGHYVRIKHTGEYSTAYAHLSRYAKGMRAGRKVKQGQVIGYVGSTGRSTGPHLHYEVIQNGKQINPMTVRSDVVEQLGGKELAQFKAQVRKIDAMRRPADETTLLARRPHL